MTITDAAAAAAAAAARALRSPGRVVNASELERATQSAGRTIKNSFGTQLENTHTLTVRDGCLMCFVSGSTRVGIRDLLLDETGILIHVGEAKRGGVTMRTIEMRIRRRR